MKCFNITSPRDFTLGIYFIYLHFQTKSESKENFIALIKRNDNVVLWAG